jgi:hypothetical protein
MQRLTITAVLFAAVTSGACSDLHASPTAPSIAASPAAVVIAENEPLAKPDPHFPAPLPPQPPAPAPPPPSAAPVALAPCGCLIVHVENAVTHRPVFHAEVNFAEKPMVYTDQNGEARFSIGYGGTVRLVVYHGEYQFYEADVPLKEETRDWPVRLTPIR